MLLGHVAIFAFGYGWLATIAGPQVAWTAGVAPFFLATVLKTALGAALVPALWTLADRRQGWARPSNGLSGRRPMGAVLHCSSAL